MDLNTNALFEFRFYIFPVCILQWTWNLDIFNSAEVQKKNCNKITRSTATIDHIIFILVIVWCRLQLQDNTATLGYS